jgi:hypothetical protein
MSSRLRIGLWAASAAVGIASLTILAAPVGAAPAGAPGNNGTVKIHEGAGEPSPVTRDETHVCTFHVHALFFDAGQVLTFTVQSWEPTGDRSVVLSGSITADSTGEGRSPVGGAYSLPDGHYRLTVDTGNGTPTQDKHKMFWVQCESQTPSPTPTETESPTPTMTPTETPTESPTETVTPTVTPTESPTETVTPTETPTESPTETTSAPSSPGTPTATSPTSTSPGAPTATSPATPTPTSSQGGPPGPSGTPPAAGGLALTGSSTAGIAGIGLALLLAGVALLMTPAARRRLMGD